VKRVIFINPFGIGDVLFTTALISQIKIAYPDSFLGYWCNERVGPLLEGQPLIDRVFAFSRGDAKRIARRSRLESIRRSLALWSELRRFRFDVALDFSLDHRYSLIAKTTGIKRRIGFNYKGRGRFLTDKINLTGYCGKHVIEYYLDLLGFLDIIPKSGEIKLAVPQAEEGGARRLLLASGIKEGDSIVGLAIGGGASWGKEATRKQWPPESFAKLAEMLNLKAAVKVLLLGDDADRPVAAKVKAAAGNCVIDLTGKTSLGGLAAVIAKLALLVANDGGPLHMAAALGIKTVSLFGPVDPLAYGPYPSGNKRHIVLRKSPGCSPCYNNFRLAVCSGDNRCLKDISVQEAFDAAGRLLGKVNVDA